MNYDKFEEFNDVLVNSIIKFMDLYELKEPNCWKIANVNLRYAIEREMYFNFIFNIDYFYKFYINKQSDSTIKKFKADILKLMIEEKIDIKIPISTTNTVLEKKIQRYTSNSSKIVFLIMSLKFLKYAEDLINQLKHKEIHLLCFDKTKELINYIEEKEYSYSLFEYYYDESYFSDHLKGLQTSIILPSFVNTLCVLKPSTIISFEGHSIVGQLSGELGKLMQIKTICIQHGYAPFYPTTFRNMNYSKFLTWGEYFSEGFKPYNPNGQFIAVGNHIIPNFDNKNKKVKVVSFFVQVTKYFISQEYYENFIELILHTAKNNQNLKIVVREHPSNPIPKKYIDLLSLEENIEFMNNETHTVGEVLEQSDVAVSISSTTLIEALEMNVIPIYVNLPKLTMYQRLKDKNPYIPMPKTVEEAIEIIKNLIDDSQYYNDLKELIFQQKDYLFKAHGKEALGNIIKEILC